MIRIERRFGHLSGNIPLTPSKSITNRILMIRALSGIDFEIVNKATANDSVILEEIFKNPGEVIDAQDAGTVYRFLTAFFSCRPGKHILTGSDRMKFRPIGQLVNALNSIGANIKYAGEENFPPLEINGSVLKGGRVIIDATESSQYISALLLIAPVLSDGLTIEMQGKIASFPYVLMTVELMRQFGITVEMKENIISVKPGHYTNDSFTIENDWSASSFWYVIASLAESAELKLSGLKQNSIQGDSVIAKIMEQFGIKTVYEINNVLISKIKNFKMPKDFEFDFSYCPDLVIPLAILCSGLNVNARFTGVKNLRIKESDRLATLKSELSKAGTKVSIEDDSIHLVPGKYKITEIINSHNDHRIAMAFVAFSSKSRIVIDDPSVVNKSYPEFWNQLNSLGYELSEISV